MERLVLKTDFEAVPSEFVCAEVRFEHTEAHNCRRHLCRTHKGWLVGEMSVLAEEVRGNQALSGWTGWTRARPNSGNKFV